MGKAAGDVRGCEVAGGCTGTLGQECLCLGEVLAIAGNFEHALAQLTAREREVLGRLALCDTNRGIARNLHITERTAKAHLTRIMAKLGLASRTEVTIVAVRYHGALCHPLGAAGVYQGPLPLTA
ncbi:response regulator transcription factor [Streptomyces violascens]|uniref:response regulator transcription factor n=1 Tax=Streptomyces violascens TaxID=67381 RepID=UPI00378ED8B7